MSPQIIIPFIIVIAITIAITAYYFGKKQRILRGLSKLKTKDILQFRTNEPTKVTGKVLHVHEPFVAPFSKRKCVAFQFKIQQKKRTGKNSYWKTLLDENNIQDFFVKDKKEEVVMIKPTTTPLNFVMYLEEDKRVTSGFLNAPTPEFENVLSAYKIESENLLGFNKTLRYTERILEVGETVTVGGIAKWKALDKTIDGYSYSKIATLESNEHQKIIITDIAEARVK
ncbi:GIDE domain-containing protein [Hyunsoonleella sp. 2307UL5-6]|uniref:GIDE domain-containing protein n=1 Tax=Hyunsoonleella sp. 2307UL5-6 TaxID=3384768 RepID=UPI0039BD406C